MISNYTGAMSSYPTTITRPVSEIPPYRDDMPLDMGYLENTRSRWRAMIIMQKKKFLSKETRIFIEKKCDDAR